MQRKDVNNSNNLQPIGICHKLYNFIVHTFFSHPLKRIALGHTSSYDTSREILLHDMSRNEDRLDTTSSEVMIEFKHNEDWTSKVNNINAAILKDGKQEENDQTIRSGFAKKPKVLSTTSVGDLEGSGTKGKGPKKTITFKDDNKEKDKQISATPVVAEGEGEIVRRLKHPRLLSVTSNINEKSDAFIKSRLEAMRNNLVTDS